MSAGPLCPAPFGIAEGSGHASAEPPRRKRARRASGGAAGEGTAGAPGGRLREGASASERRKLHNPRTQGLWQFSRGRAGGRGSGAKIGRSSRMRRKMRRGPELFSSAARKRSRAAPRGCRAQSPRALAPGGTSSPQGEGAREGAGEGRAMSEAEYAGKSPGNSANVSRPAWKAHRPFSWCREHERAVPIPGAGELG